MKPLWTIKENKPWESSADIIKEAKSAVAMTTLTKTVQTKRPNTPKEPNRTLLGHAQGYNVFRSCSQEILNYPSAMTTFFQILKKYPGREDIVVRLTYALGNLAADDDSARIQIASEKDSIPILVDLLEIYLSKDMALMTQVRSNDSKKERDRDSLIEDVMIKIIRIIANLSLNDTVGKQLTSSTLENNCSERIVNVLLSCIRYKTIYESEELLLVTLTTLNNLTFYTQSDSQQDSPISKRTLEIAQALSTLMLISQKDCLIEIARVYGNLSRSEDVRNYLVDTRALYQLMKWLDQDDRELKLTTVGVLVNTMPDEDKRDIFKKDKGLEKFLFILEETKQTRDWEMGCLICQGVWNYMIDTTDVVDVCGENNTFMLIDLLITLLDEDNLTDQDHYEEWEKFAHVGTNLLEKIETFFEGTTPLSETDRSSFSN
ncbi:armadillo repeat-containing protein 2-like [Diaphorina citri]|uniref:Armadillo repeat-containing protein 2-like n=1 Tax=Diaphorina citri TaxID=121845 RepID=A0A3Q0IKD9_DIACI|nr:armadillo repeat-containing protein 2-like [Diaphorina citri]